MTKDQSIKWAAEIAALQAGKVVQSRAWYWAMDGLKQVKDWADDSDPDFSNNFMEFRVRPEPRRVWLYENDLERACWSPGTYAAPAFATKPPTGAVEFVEVIR